MRLLNPCKKCIVQPMCSEICEQRHEMTYSYGKILKVLPYPNIVFIGICITLLFDDHRWFLRLNSICLLTVSMIQLIFYIMERRIKIANIVKFQGRNMDPSYGSFDKPKWVKEYMKKIIGRF